MSERIPVLLFDGDCGLCNALVRAMLRRDRAGRLMFAPLQSAPAQEFLGERGLPTSEFSSLVFVPDWGARRGGRYLLRTDGALAAAAELGGGWAAAARLGLVPRPIRDAAYRLVAATRHAVFGRHGPAPLPNPAWEARFLAR
ncbi:MAG TPA: DCC1-like thiol-disulfide oxidoreductase family protein [Opitutaceae bacterium]|jgi:predicted DCC family thiol-disulfide oxidoreductase YuxK